MELKLTKEQEELLLKNYERTCTRGAKLSYSDKTLTKVFLLECIGDMLSQEVNDKLHAEMVADAFQATIDFLSK